MNTILQNEYRTMRTHKPFMLVGRDAECSLSSARTVLAFRELEAQGVARIRCEHEQENYFSVYGEPDTEKERQSIIDAIDRMGCVVVIVEVWRGCAECGRGEWEHVDSIGMCIYDNPLSPYENCYVIGMMESAIKALTE